MDSLERTLAEIRSKAAELRNSFGDEERAEERLSLAGISEVRLFPGPPGQTHPGRTGARIRLMRPS